jgi:hypothetical protein
MPKFKLLIEPWSVAAERKSYLRGRLITVDLLVKVACFVKRKICKYIV